MSKYQPMEKSSWKAHGITRIHQSHSKWQMFYVFASVSIHFYHRLIRDSIIFISVCPTTEISGTGHLLFGLAAAEAEGRARRSQIADVPVSAESTCWVGEIPQAKITIWPAAQ